MQCTIPGLGFLCRHQLANKSIAIIHIGAGEFVSVTLDIFPVRD